MDYLKCSAKWKLDKLLFFMPPNGTVIQMKHASDWSRHAFAE